VTACYSAETDIDVVYLKNGSIMRGKIIEQIVGESVKLETSDGSIYVLSSGDIEKIQRETKTVPPSQQTFVQSTTSPGYKDPSKAFMYSFIPPILVPVQGLGQIYIGKTDEGLGYFLTGLISWA